MKLKQRVLFRKAAQMAKLVDALVSGTSVSNDVQVRVLFWAPPKRRAQSGERRAKRKKFCPEPNALSPELFRPDGEIGRHASLRGWCSQGCASSSLVLGTKTRLFLQSGFFYFISITHFACGKSSQLAVSVTIPALPVGLSIARQRP
jgi:hypothetical protein